ncbi:MAG: hypothetical protein IJK74_03145 [Bacteroidales bacterium]|nr:hypothetical protein [Bacteroidales bacterium]
MKSFFLKTSCKLLLVALASMFITSIASAQDWNGRRYISEDPGKCHDFIVGLISSEKEFKDMPAVEKQKIMAFFAIAEVNSAIVFKSKNRFSTTVIFKINEKIAQAIGMDTGELEYARQTLAELSNDLKTVGTYTIENGMLICISKDGEKNTFRLLDNDGKRIQSEDVDKLIYKQVK